MARSLGVALLSTAVSLSFGCSFFELDSKDLQIPPKKPAAAAGTPGAAGMATLGGAGGMQSTSGGTAGEAPSTGGTNAAGTGGSAMAGTGGSAGDGMMAGAGGASGGMPATGGVGGDATAAGGMSAGSAQGGMPGAGTGSGGASTCASLNAMSQAFAGHCYLLVTTTATWDGAKSACAGMNGAHLVTISDASTDDFNAEDMFVYTLSGMKDTWLGITDGKMPKDPGDGTPYKWITGEADPPAGAWQDGEPNNYNKPCANQDSCYEHCGFMVENGGDKWNDDLCEAMKQYVCEWDMGG